MGKPNNIRALVALTSFIGASVACAADEPTAPAAPSSQVPAPEIMQCVVYSDSDKSKQRDCLAQARSICVQKAPTCELPIGLGLTNNEQIDGDAKSWKKVLVKYRCNQAERVNGPHIQDDHATMVLSCLGRM
jgi:hypothetical protein